MSATLLERSAGGDAAAPGEPGRRGRWLRRLLGAVVGSALLVGAGWLLFVSPVLGVDRVTVSGTSRLTADQVRGTVAVPLQTPLARVDLDAVRARVHALRPVESVRLERRWPGTLHVRVVERRAVAWVLRDGGRDLVDRTGAAFARAGLTGPPPPGTVRLQVDRVGPRDGATRSALTVLAALPPELRGRLGILRGETRDRVVLMLQDGRKVVWGGPERSADKVAVVQALLRLPGRLYDVRSPDVVTRSG